MSNTTNLVLPYLAVGQAQKHVTVNETLRRLDAVVQLTVVSATIPRNPDRRPMARSTSCRRQERISVDAFANWSLGYYRDGAWEQIAPREGWLAYVGTDLLLPTGSAGVFAPEAADLSATTGCSAGRVRAQARRRRSPARPLVARCSTMPMRGPVRDAGHVARAGGIAVARRLPARRPRRRWRRSRCRRGDGPERRAAHHTLWSYTNSANNKTCAFASAAASERRMRCEHDGHQHRSSARSRTATRRIRRSPARQRVRQLVRRQCKCARHRAAIDTSIDQDIVLSGQLANAGETVTLESYMVEVAHRA